MFEPLDRIAQEALARQCVARAPGAWGRLLAAYGRRLARYAHECLSRAGRSDWNLAEEVVAELWKALVESDYRRLRAYDPGRATLEGYLRWLVREQIALLYRQLGRRAAEDHPLPAEAVPDPGGAVWPLEVWMGECRSSLTPKEGEYWDVDLLGIRESDGPVSTEAGCWKLKQGIREKVHRYLDGERP